MFEHYNKSFSTKLSLYVISFITILSVILFGIFYHYSTRTLSAEAKDKIETMAEIANLKVSSLLGEVEKIPDNLGWMIMTYVKEPDSLFTITRRIVKENEEIFECAIAFEPYYFASKGLYFAPCSFMSGDTVKTMQIGGEEYNYFEKDWYKEARGAKYWGKPSPSASDPEMITTSYAVPVYGEAGELIAVLTVNLTDKWLRELANSIKPYEGSFTVIVDKQGRYVTRKEGDTTIDKHIFQMTDDSRNPYFSRLITEMSAGKSGCMVAEDGETLTYVYYTRVFATDWYMIVVCPYDQVFGKLNQFNMYILIGFVLLLVFVYVVCFLAVRGITKPLTCFSESARNIAAGNFNTPLPVVRSKDELGELYDSFQFMQQQLTEYVERLRSTTTANEKIESELRIAHDIQLGMVPKNFVPPLSGESIDIYAILRPARQVGGDFYDYFMLNEDEFGFVIGDVSGKGVPAALFMSTTISQMRSVAMLDTSLNYVMNVINHSLIRNGNAGMFVTFFAGVLNLNTRQLRYCNAGHPYPVMVHPDGSVGMFKTTDNLPLGVTSDYDYEEQRCYFAPESQLILYSDGVTEAQDEDFKFYKIERLLQFIEGNKNLSSKEVVDRIIADVDTYAGEAEQSDDLTVMSLRYDTRK